MNQQVKTIIWTDGIDVLTSHVEVLEEFDIEESEHILDREIIRIIEEEHGTILDQITYSIH